MTIKTVKIKNIHLDNAEDSGSRAISIKISGGTIETPTRSLAASELMKLKNVRNNTDVPVSPFEAAEEPFPWKIFEGTLQYNHKTIKSMTDSDNGISKKRSNINSKISPLNNILGEGESQKLLKIIYPQTKLGEEYSIQDLQMLAEIQMYSKVDIIVLPETKSGCNLEEFKETIKEVEKFLSDFGNTKPIMPMIDIHCNLPNFENKLNYLYDSGFGMSGIVCHTYHSHVGLHILRSKANKFENFWIHGFGAFRNRRNSELYNPHAAQLWGIDSVGIGSNGGYPPKENSQNTESSVSERFETLRVYNGDDWGIYRLNESQITDSLCDCDGCKYYNRSESLKQNSLDVHEAFKSQEQNEIARKRIMDDSYKELIKEKKQVKKYYETEIGDLNQSRLLKWGL